MTRVWAAVAATLTLLLVLAGAVAMAVAGPDRDDRWGDGPMGGRAGSVGHMMGGGRAGMVASSEYEYLAGMVSHHEEAIAAARELRRSDSPRMREFGAGIVASQSAQVEQMTGWLEEWYPDRPAYDPDYRAEMRDLSGLSGRALDRAFLTDMIGHHMMAVMSSQHLLVQGTAEHDEVADLARTIRDEQWREIRQMRRWLGWSGAGWMPVGPGHGPGAMMGGGTMAGGMMRW